MLLVSNFVLDLAGLFTGVSLSLSSASFSPKLFSGSELVQYPRGDYYRLTGITVKTDLVIAGLAFSILIFFLASTTLCVCVLLYFFFCLGPPLNYS